MTVRPRPDKSRSAAKPFSSIDAGILALARVHRDLSHGAALTSGSCSFEQLRERWREHGQVILADAVDAKAHHVEERCDWPAGLARPAGRATRHTGPVAAGREASVFAGAVRNGSAGRQTTRTL